MELRKCDRCELARSHATVDLCAGRSCEVFSLKVDKAMMGSDHHAAPQRLLRNSILYQRCRYPRNARMSTSRLRL